MKRLLALLLTLGMSLIGTAAKAQYTVTYDDFLFVCEGQQHLFAAGETVHLSFPLIATDTDYSFAADGVDDFRSGYSDQEGYFIEFVMPANDVSVRYSAENTMERPFTEDTISFSFDENPSTGFLWEYAIWPAGIIRLKDEWYVSDADPDDEPVEGTGGTHYWAFEVIGEGEAVIALSHERGPTELDRQNGYYEYHYVCDGETATLVDVRTERPAQQIFTLALEENPSTGFLWEYSFAPEGIIEGIAEWFKSDEEDSDIPTTGAGGIRHWVFQVIGDGETILTLTCQRSPDEVMEVLEYVYECIGGSVDTLDIIAGE